MASTSEVGHNKNVANFNAVYQVLQEMGTIYNPTNENIKLQNLEPIKQLLQNNIQELNNKLPIYKNAVAKRESEMQPLSKTITKALNFAKSINLSPADKENIKAQADKLRGQKNAKPKTTEATSTETISTSQLSYDSRIANLQTLIEQLASYPQYTPNETEIKIETLQNLKDTLAENSAQVNAAANTLITARANRNKTLYTDTNNVINLIKDIKAYLKSVGDPAKPYYNAIVKLKFIRSI